MWKKERSKTLCEIGKELEKLYQNKFLNATCEILIEENNIGCTSNYLKVKIEKKLENNTCVKVRITGHDKEGLIGEVLENINSF